MLATSRYRCRPRPYGHAPARRGLSKALRSPETGHPNRSPARSRRPPRAVPRTAGGHCAPKSTGTSTPAATTPAATPSPSTTDRRDWMPRCCSSPASNSSCPVIHTSPGPLTPYSANWSRRISFCVTALMSRRWTDCRGGKASSLPAPSGWPTCWPGSAAAERPWLFERLLALRNDVGLLSEEHDIARHRQVGNFPQAYSHVSIINTAAMLTNGGDKHTRCAWSAPGPGQTNHSTQPGAVPLSMIMDVATSIETRPPPGGQDSDAVDKMRPPYFRQVEHRHEGAAPDVLASARDSATCLTQDLFRGARPRQGTAPALVLRGRQRS